MLFARRADSRITKSEAICLLRSALTALPTGQSCDAITTLREDDNQFVAAADDSCANSAQRAPLTLSVDRYDGIVTDVQTGESYKSAAVDRLRGNLLTSHSPARLTIDDAKRIAAAYSATLGARDAGCARIDVDPQYNADEAWLQLSRGCGDRAVVKVLSVNALTGAIRIVGPNTSPDSLELRTLRRDILREAQFRKTMAAEAVQTACR